MGTVAAVCNRSMQDAHSNMMNSACRCTGRLQSSRVAGNTPRVQRAGRTELSFWTRPCSCSLGETAIVYPDRAAAVAAVCAFTVASASAATGSASASAAAASGVE